MREERERRQQPGWSFNAYFLLQEELAFMFEMLGLYEDALVQYDELDALFTQFVRNHSAGGQSVTANASTCCVVHLRNLWLTLRWYTILFCSL